MRFSIINKLCSIILTERKMLTFRHLNLITFVLSTTLGTFLLLIPDPIFHLFGLVGNESAYFVARRASMFFLGYAVISYFSRNAQPSTTRQAISLGVALSMFGFAILGTLEFIRGFAGGGVFLPVSAEVFLAVSYFSIWLSDKKEIA